MSGTTSFSMFAPTQLSQLGYLHLDVMLTESLTLPSEVTRYPIEDGSEDVSDHITRGNEELSINGSISCATSFGMEFGAGQHSKLIDAIDQLRNMHKERKPISVTTGLGTYTDMGFTGLTVSRGAGDKGGNWIDINATLRQIKRVALKQAELPPERASGAPSASGAKGKTGVTERRASKTGTSSLNPADSAAGANNTPLLNLALKGDSLLGRSPGTGGLVGPQYTPSAALLLGGAPA